MAPIRRVQPDPVPLHRLLPQEFVQGHIDPLDRQVAVHAQRNEMSNEAVKIRMLLDQRPIEPGDFVVLAKGVVVPH